MLSNLGEVCLKMEQLCNAQTAKKKKSLVGSSNSTYYLWIVNN